MQAMKNRKDKRVEETIIMISIMNDDMPIYKFNMLKHSVIAEIDKSRIIKK